MDLKKMAQATGGVLVVAATPKVAHPGKDFGKSETAFKKRYLVTPDKKKTENRTVLNDAASIHDDLIKLGFSKPSITKDGPRKGEAEYKLTISRGNTVTVDVNGKEISFYVSLDYGSWRGSVKFDRDAFGKIRETVTYAKQLSSVTFPKFLKYAD